MNVPEIYSKLWRHTRAKAGFSFSSTRAVANGNAVCAYWSRHPETVANFGDAINPAVIEYLTGKPAVHASETFYFGSWPTIYCVGSILNGLSEGRAMVLGAGFMSRNADILRRPKYVFAVRGPLTRNVFMTMGVDCPEVYCDPGLILPRIYPATSQGPVWDVGIVPHYVDRQAVDSLVIESGGLSYAVIDVNTPGPEFVKEITRCRYVVSSSLHGLIAAHAYGVPAAWIRFSGGIGGNGFKFADYYASLGSEMVDPYDLSIGKLDLQDVIARCTAFDVSGNVEALERAAESARAVLAVSEYQ